MMNVPMAAQIQNGKKTWRYVASSPVRLTDEEGAVPFVTRCSSSKLDDDDDDDDDDDGELLSSVEEEMDPSLS